MIMRSCENDDVIYVCLELYFPVFMGILILYDNKEEARKTKIVNISWVKLCWWLGATSSDSIDKK